MGDDDVDLEPGEVGGKLGRAVASPFGVAELDGDVLAFRIAERAEPLPERIGERVRG